MKSVVRFTASLTAGCVVAGAIAYLGFAVLRALWHDYAAAVPHKNYTLAMLLARLAVGAVCTAGGACVTTVVARDSGRAAWWFGGLILVVSIPGHLYPGYVWKDYPVWYHLLYLGYLVPIAGLSPRLFRNFLDKSRSQEVAA